MKKTVLRAPVFVLLACAIACVPDAVSASSSIDVLTARAVDAFAQRVPAQPRPVAMQLAQAQPVPAEDLSGDNGSRPVASTARAPRELSPWSMFLGADILVKAVMICLAIASLVTWTIFIAMTFHLALARRRVQAAMARIANLKTLAEAQLALGAKRHVVSALLGAVTSEIRLSADSLVESGLKERVATRFSEIIKLEARVARQGMGILATIGAVSPFVGLFGTVWGIMNSFIGISKSQTTNLAVVAPGIAEALLATALGLVAAVPAVIIYNYFSRSTRNYLELVGRASGIVARLLSRDLDRSRSAIHTRAAE
jgi:biopolymer transport protein ExbB